MTVFLDVSLTSRPVSFHANDHVGKWNLKTRTFVVGGKWAKKNCPWRKIWRINLANSSYIMRYFSFGWIWHSICSWKYRKYPLSNQTMVSQQENYPPKWLAPSVNRGIIQKELSSFVVPAGIAFHLDVAMTAAFPEIIKIREVEERREIICVHSTFNDHRLISKNKLPDLTMASWFGKLKPTFWTWPPSFWVQCLGLIEFQTFGTNSPSTLKTKQRIRWSCLKHFFYAALRSNRPE